MMTPLFYGNLVIAMITGNTEQVKELIQQLNEQQLKDLWITCEVLARYTREAWYQFGTYPDIQKAMKENEH